MKEAKMDLDRTRAEETSKWLWVAGQKEGEEKDGQKQHGVELLKRKEMERVAFVGESQTSEQRQKTAERKCPGRIHLLARRGLTLREGINTKLNKKNIQNICVKDVHVNKFMHVNCAGNWTHDLGVASTMHYFELQEST